MLYTGITLAAKHLGPSYCIKVVVDASTPAEALEIANDFIDRHNEAARYKAPIPLYKRFEAESDFHFSTVHPGITIIDNLQKLP